MKTILIILVLLFANLDIYSQNIRLVRTDVDSTRKDFVTATYMFGYDVVIENLENCNNASFQLKFDNSQYIKYSGAMLNDFKDSGTVFIYENSVPGSNEVFLNVGVFSGEALGENDFDNPNILHLEFVVTPTAPNKELVTFTFLNAFGSTYKDSVGQSIQLTSTPTLLDIHGYVEVWPGDTDNNLLVDNVDWTNVYENLKFKQRFPGYRSFKRENSTTNWFPQRSLVWDVEKATYADCDGDGEISVTDGLVVLLNLTAAQGVAKQKPAVKLQNQDNLIPISIEHFRDYRGVFGQIELGNIEVEDVIVGELFQNADAMFHVEHNVLNFTLGNFNKADYVTNSGVAFYLKTKNSIDNPEYDITQLRGISDKNTLFNLAQNVSSVKEDNDYTVNYTNNTLTIESDKQIESIKLIDLNGNTVINDAFQKQFSINLQSGYYLLLIESDNKTIKYPLMILK